MSVYLILLATSAASVSILRSMRRAWARRRLARWTVAIGGSAAWMLVGSVAVWIGHTVVLLAEGVQGNISSLSLSLGGFLLTGLAIKVASVADIGPLRDFLVESLLFRNYERRSGGYDVEQAQQVLENHHRQMGEQETARRLLDERTRPAQDPEALLRELETSPRIKRSPDLSRELELLRGGSPVDLTDAWRLYWYSKELDEPFGGVSAIRLDPLNGELAVHQLREDLESDRIVDTLKGHRLRQDLFDLMASLWNTEWITPYAHFVRRIAVTAYGTSMDSFGVANARAVCKSWLPIGRLQNPEHALRDIRDIPFERLPV